MQKTALWCAVKILDQCTPAEQPSPELVSLITDLVSGLRNDTSVIDKIVEDVQGLRNAVTRIGNVVGLSKTVGEESKWQQQRSQSAV